MALIGGITALASYALLGAKLWAFIDAITREGQAFEAAGKLTKPAWLLILGIAVVAHLIDMYPIGILNIIGTVAAFVYLLDVRPAVQQLRRR